MLVDRPNYNCIPINLTDRDLMAYSRFQTKIIVQKVTDHVNLGLKGQKAFEADQMRLGEFCEVN